MGVGAPMTSDGLRYCCDAVSRDFSAFRRFEDEDFAGDSLQVLEAHAALQRRTRWARWPVCPQRIGRSRSVGILAYSL